MMSNSTQQQQQHQKQKHLGKWMAINKKMAHYGINRVILGLR